MIPPLRIAVAEPEPEMRAYFHKVLLDMGHQVVALAPSGRALVELCRTADPNLVITAVQMLDMDGIRAAGEICATNPVPIILTSACHDRDVMECSLDDHVMAYLVKPIAGGELELAMILARRHFERFQALHQEVADLQQTLKDRKVIERAKGLLMKRAGLDEEAAFQRLQKLARSHGRKMAEVARVILSMGDIFEPPAAP